MSKTNKRGRAQRTRGNTMSKATRRANRRDVNAGVLGMPVSWPGSSAVSPGRAYVRMVTEVFSSDDSRLLSRAGFQTWSSQLDGILSPYRFFRVAEASAEVLLSGGAASTYSCAFNISNSPSSDTGAPAILNDDYSGVSTALIRPKLSPPAKYWSNRPVEWYQYSTVSDVSLTTAGAISLAGYGGTTSTVIGYLVCDIVVEFHTLY